ncbi:GIN domain-containing protein [Amantichitinum ursilacus]|uniref:Putative auto-transporter adhesin head GIN domain-containing protein n=1 Tax=Amantichitinum ursilacus TaxID=857265 RepID=A0A0N0XMD1_9NEIS|nr:DUF2807 domain-containing protein [Amantichitinum ursilacus]KPC55012.1 hypothetical protein WG78_00095 [Amantichitinum ursilacus]
MLPSRTLIAAALLSCLGSAYGADQTETRQLARFTEIRIKAPVDMTYTVGPTASLQVSASAEMLSQLVLSVSNGELTIDAKSGSDFHHGVRVVATGPLLTGVSIDGAGNFKATGLTGAAFNTRIAGAGSISATGAVHHINASVKGAGDIDLKKLTAKDAVITIAGTGSVKAYASESVAVTVNGVGSVDISGKPAKRDVTTHGIGSVSFD